MSPPAVDELRELARRPRARRSSSSCARHRPVAAARRPADDAAALGPRARARRPSWRWPGSRCCSCPWTHDRAVWLAHGRGPPHGGVRASSARPCSRRSPGDRHASRSHAGVGPSVGPLLAGELGVHAHLPGPTFAMPVIVLVNVDADENASFYVAWGVAALACYVPDGHRAGPALRGRARRRAPAQPGAAGHRRGRGADGGRRGGRHASGAS